MGRYTKMSVYLVVLVLVFSLWVAGNYHKSNFLAQGKYHFSPVIKLATTSGFGFCSATVVSDTYAITAAHCLLTNGVQITPFGIQEVQVLKPDAISIYNSDNQFTGTIGYALGANNRMDYGIITGDFRMFNRLSIDPDNNGFVDTMDTPRTVCGYPFNRAKPLCYKYQPTGWYNFQVLGDGYVAPGMSGGTVINPKTGYLDGVIVGVTNGQVIVAPLLGLFTSLGLEKL